MPSSCNEQPELIPDPMWQSRT